MRLGLWHSSWGGEGTTWHEKIVNDWFAILSERTASLHVLGGPNPDTMLLTISTSGIQKESMPSQPVLYRLGEHFLRRLIGSLRFNSTYEVTLACKAMRCLSHTVHGCLLAWNFAGPSSKRCSGTELPGIPSGSVPIDGIITRLFLLPMNTKPMLTLG